jgi:hypothetical protein
MNEATPVLANSPAAVTLTHRPPSALDEDKRLSGNARLRTYCVLKERPADFNDIFVPARRRFIEAAITYISLGKPPAEFSWIAVLAPPRRRPADAALATYKALSEPPDESAEAMKVPSTTTAPEMPSPTSKQAEEIASPGGAFTVTVPAFGRETGLAPTPHHPVAARPTPTRID